MRNHPCIIEVDLNKKLARMIIGTTHYPNSPTSFILSFNKLISTIPSKISQNGIQGVSPEGLQFKFDSTFLDVLQDYNDFFESDIEVLNLKKEDSEQNFFPKMETEGRSFLNVDYLKNLAVPSHAIISEKFNLLYQQKYENKINALQKKTN